MKWVYTLDDFKKELNLSDPLVKIKDSIVGLQFDNDIFAAYNNILLPNCGRTLLRVLKYERYRIRILYTESRWVVELSPQKMNNDEYHGCLGLLKWWANDDSKRYGVLTCVYPKSMAMKEIFFHHSNWVDGRDINNNNLPLFSFDVVIRHGRYETADCRYYDGDNLKQIESIINDTIEIETDSRHHVKRKVVIIDSMFSTIDIVERDFKKECLESLVANKQIELTPGTKKKLLLAGYVPSNVTIEDDWMSIVNNLNNEELVHSIVNTQKEDFFVELVNQKIKASIIAEFSDIHYYADNNHNIHKSIIDIINAFRNNDIQTYLWGTFFESFPKEITEDNIDLFISACSCAWKDHNRALPMSILDRFPHVKFLLWSGGAKIPLERQIAKSFVEHKDWFVNWLIEHIGIIQKRRNDNNIYYTNNNPLSIFSLARRRLTELTDFKNDDGFQQIYRWYSFLKSKEQISKIKNSKNPVCQILLWIDEKVDEIDIDTASKVFIYLDSMRQVLFVKRLIQRKVLGDERINLDTLQNLVYADLELYKDNKEINPNRTLDISTFVLIELLRRFKGEGKFMLESELFITVFSQIKGIQSPFKLKYYFDKCQGRCCMKDASRPDSREGRNHFWFPHGLDGFCDAQKINKKEESGDEYYWCGNARCYKNTVKIHEPNEWKDYSVWDMIHVLGLHSKCKEDDMYAAYITFVAQVNKFNQIAERLKCRECGKLLYPTLPIGTSNFHYYTVTKFYCKNEKCSQFDKEVYISHCFHPKCYDIIDSRDSKKCENGRYICPSCAHCCTDWEFEKTIQKYGSTGYVSPLIMHYYINKLGHNNLKKDNLEYIPKFFCYKCGKELKRVEGSEGLPLKQYVKDNGYKWFEPGAINCRNGYEMPGLFLKTTASDSGNFVAFGKDSREQLNNKNSNEIEKIIGELRVVDYDKGYKQIVCQNILDQKIEYYCEQCKEVRYQIKNSLKDWKYYDSSHVIYEMERMRCRIDDR